MKLGFCQSCELEPNQWISARICQFCWNKPNSQISKKKNWNLGYQNNFHMCKRHTFSTKTFSFIEKNQWKLGCVWNTVWTETTRMGHEIESKNAKIIYVKWKLCLRRSYYVRRDANVEVINIKNFCDVNSSPQYFSEVGSVSKFFRRDWGFQ